MLRNRLLVLAAALLFSTGGAAFKAASLSGWQVASFRSAVATVFLLAVLPEARRDWRWSIVPVAMAYAATLITFVLANRLTTAANAIFLQSTAPLYFLLLGPLVLREPIRRGDLLYMMAVAAGMTVFFIGSEAPMLTAPDPPRGNLIAVASGFCYALMLAGLRWLAREGMGNPAVATVVLGNVMACLAAAPMSFPVHSGGMMNIAVILYLGVVQVGLGYICLTTAIRHVPAFEATTLLMIEPAMSPLWTWLVHRERPGNLPLAGGAVILAATLINTWRQSRAVRFNS
jgi:drug/metabolite transporter (DMT)-like permease